MKADEKQRFSARILPPHRFSLPFRDLLCASHSACGKAWNPCLKKIKLVEQSARQDVANTKEGAKMAVLLRLHSQRLLLFVVRTTCTVFPRVHKLRHYAVIYVALTQL